jgi:hypothetical protein
MRIGMELTERLQLSRVLLGELDKMIVSLEPYDDELDEIYSRALHLKMKMKMVGMQYEQASEILEQIDFVDKVIKKLEVLKNKRGTF